MSTNEFAAFEALDLSPIKMKLMHVESGEGWSATRTDAVETEYRRFLFLMKKYPDAQASPTVDVDTFWHYHILDTMKYARDCDAVFGYFLHHYPYVGIGAEIDDAEHIRGGERMREIYEAEFGPRPSAQAAWCTRAGEGPENTAWCTRAGKGPDNTAWCTRSDKALESTAWCTRASKGSDSTAWCTRAGKGPDSTAWCTRAGKEQDVSAGQASAWCTSPGKPRAAAAAIASAWCTSPGQRFASSAWCTSPGTALAGGAFAQIAAWCTSPGKQHESANAARASCSSPGLPSQPRPGAMEHLAAAEGDLAHAA